MPRAGADSDSPAMARAGAADSDSWCQISDDQRSWHDVVEDYVDDLQQHDGIIDSIDEGIDEHQAVTQAQDVTDDHDHDDSGMKSKKTAEEPHLAHADDGAVAMDADGAQASQPVQKNMYRPGYRPVPMAPGWRPRSWELTHMYLD